MSEPTCAKVLSWTVEIYGWMFLILWMAALLYMLISFQ